MRSQFLRALSAGSFRHSRAYSALSPLETHCMFQRLKWDRLTQGEAINENLKQRRERANVQRLRELWKEFEQHSPEGRVELEGKLLEEALRLPNDTHQASLECGNEPKVIRVVGEPLSIPKPKEFHELCVPKNFLRKNDLGEILGTRAYIIQGFLAELEQALINYTVDVLRVEGFQFISVPDLLYGEVIEQCGFPVKSDRNMVYEIETEEGERPFHLSGTAEMGIGAYLSNRTFNKSHLPFKLASISRCFRAEVSSTEEERGIYRVHNFSKVEMFALTPGSPSCTESDTFHTYLLNLEEKLFSSLGLHYRVLEMPPNDLGSPAYRKYDIEAWMPGRQQFGEISSASNCTDYQSRRLNIRYREGPSEVDMASPPHFAHTLNGTACAIPRMLIALVETHQDEKGHVTLPAPLQKYMHSTWDSDFKTKNIYKHAVFMKNVVKQRRVTHHYDAWRSGEESSTSNQG